MTYFNGNNDNECCKTDREFSECKPQHQTAKSILLECGRGTGRRIFASSDDTPFQIARVTIDTTSLKKPNVLIKFSSSVRFEGEPDATIRLKYELFKGCGEGSPISCNLQVYEKINGDLAVNASTEDTFGFITCDCMTSQRCCDYFITVTPIEISGASAIVFNGQITALAQSSRN
ncbi:DUF4489 domain-containing protein [Vallitalea okinawensis]|uniref:DUF4489 domain-containing protein n=1 Tax=Vallitalea okinawensis TaxID=2078660 RepID=UPI001300A1D5|nr:DUF4489 domain-containing protein [Vallitalea okinawensis]